MQHRASVAVLMLRGPAEMSATEDVVYMLDGMGVKTGIDLEKLVAAGQQISRELGRESASRVGRLQRRWPSRAA